MSTKGLFPISLVLSIAATGIASANEGALTHGPYLRAELGGALPRLSGGNWLPPGRADPRVFFDLGADPAAVGTIALGYEWQNGFRGDLSLMRTGSIGFSGLCSSASDGSDCVLTPHANISAGSVRTTAMMINLFYAPFEASGSGGGFQPWVTVGAGMARNTVPSWTRENRAAPQPVRVFGSNTQDQFAWSVGIGASWQLAGPADRPMLLDVGWRYYDFGSAEGGATPDVGRGIPRQPLNFDLTSHVFSIGIRVPLR